MSEYSLFTEPAVIEVQDIHSSWIYEMPNGKLIGKLRKVPSAQKPLSDFIKKYIYLDDTKIVDEFSKKIHQTHPETLNEVVLKTGATLLSNSIRQTITKKDVIQIKDSLGEDLYDFSIKKAPLIYNSLGANNRYYFDQDCTPLNSVISLGYRSLRLALGSIDSSCIYKLPKNWDTDYSNDTDLKKSESINVIFHKELVTKVLIEA
jgi:hypothetical protein